MFKNVHNIFFVSRFQEEENKIMEVDRTCEMEKVTLLKKTDNDVEYSLPYGWKKFGHKRKNSNNWDFYLISLDNKRFRSNPEVKRYLENNPTIKCDLSVTNTQWSSALKSLEKLNSDLKEPESELFIKSKATPIIPKLSKNPKKFPRSPLSKKTKYKICNKMFKHGDLPPKSLTCDTCDYMCDHPTQLTSHKRIIHEEKLEPLQCAHCRLQVRTQPELDKHLRNIHSKEKSFVCNMCGHRFNKKSNMVKHVKMVHEKLRPWTCEECNKSFSDRRDLVAHEDSVHKGIKPFDCPYCDYKCARKKNMYVHIKNIHGKKGSQISKPSYECGQCGHVAKHCWLLEKHIHSVHEITVKEFQSLITKKEPDFMLATELDNEMLSEPSDESMPNSKSDSDFSIQQRKKLLIEKIKGIKSTRSEISSEYVTLSKTSDDIMEYSLPYGWKKVCHKRKSSDKWDVSLIHPDGKKFRSTIAVERYLDENPDVKCDRSVTNTTLPNDLPKNESQINKNNDKHVKLNNVIKKKHELKAQKATEIPEVKSCEFNSLPTSSLVTNVSHGDKKLVSSMKSDDQKPKIYFFNPWNVSDLSVFLRYCCPECDFKCEETHLFCEHAIDQHENSSALLKNQQCEISQNSLVDSDKVVSKLIKDAEADSETDNSKQEICDDNYENFEVVQEFDNFDEQYSFNEDLKTKSGKQSLDLQVDFHDLSEETNRKKEVKNDNDESYEAVQEFDNFDQQYSDKQALHEGKKSFQCEFCVYATAEKRRLTRHIQAVHERKKPFMCELCGFASSEKIKLKLHIETKKHKTKQIQAVHEVKKPFLCEFCVFATAVKRGLTRHIRAVHERKKPFLCELCGFASSEKRKLKLHIETVHERKKPLKCEFCVYATAYQQHLNQHLQANHKGMKQHFHQEFECQLCAHSFVTKINLDKHVQSVHEEKKSC